MIDTTVQQQGVTGRRFFCYILECSDGTFYSGWSTNPERRARQHNAGRGAKYTRSRHPVRLVYIEECPDRSTAMKRERVIKALSRLKKEALIRRGQPLQPPREGGRLFR